MPDSWDYTKTERPAEKTDHIPIITYLLIFLCVLFTAASATGASSTITARHNLYLLTQVGTPENVWRGQYWVFLSSLFVHANPVHILFNMLWLYALGSLMERSINPVVYVLFIASAGIVSGGCEILWSGDMGIGFSGVVYAMFGLAWMGRFRHTSWQPIANQQNMNIMVLWAFGCWIATAFHAASIANGAHFGGFAFGLSVGYLIYGKRLRWLAAIPTTALVVGTIVAATWMPWSGEWNLNKACQNLAHGNYKSAVKYYENCQRLHFDAPKSGLWNFTKATLELYQRHYASAVAYYQMCQKLGYDPPDVARNLGVTWFEWAGVEFDSKNYPQSITYYQYCVPLGYDLKDTWHNIGAAWHNMAVQAWANHNYAMFQIDSQQAISAHGMELKST